MIHPLVDDLSDLTDQDLDQKVKDLTSKYFAAQRFGNPQVLTQLLNFLTIYREEMTRRSLERKLKTDDDNDLDQLINVD